MDLITTHIGADFDALASVVAAKKLYPAAKAVLPGSAQRNVREFLSLWKDRFEIYTEKEVNLEDVTRLIIVETRIASRIGRASELLGEKGLKIHIFDHHPRSKGDIKADKEIYKNVGATVTLLVNLIKRKKIPLSPIEATCMALGIYEDTGSLTFQTTKKMDIDMVGYLFSQGANLNVVSTYLKHELTQKQLNVLSGLINNTKTYMIKGVSVGIAFLEGKEYVEDFAILVHRLLDIENFNVVFAFIGRERDYIQMVARSNISCVDVARIASYFGGGGHPYAAGAKIKNMSMPEVELKLKEILKKKINPKVYAEDIISTKPSPVEPHKTVLEVKRLMGRLKRSALPVLKEEKLVGVITRENLEKAIHRGYSRSKIKGYMNVRPVIITPKTPLYKMRRLIINEDIGHLPVVKKEKLLGMVSREDLIRAVHYDLIAEDKELPKEKISTSPIVGNVKSGLRRNLPKKIGGILKLIGDLADKYNYNAFCVGGFVRDLLLRVPNFDVDIVLEKNAIKFGRLLSDKIGGSLVVHKKFGTATVVMPWGTDAGRGPQSKVEKFKIDIATARTEQYPYPAALPEVKFSSIKQDLYRRDFTINAMAISVNRRNFGDLIDFFGGRRDLKAGKVRVLHDLSFVEDPTRIFRAVRFEQRYDFKIEPHTEELIKTAVSLDMFGRTQKQRLRDELILILSEDEPIKAMNRMNQLHELRFIHPKLKLYKRTLKLLEGIKEVCSWYKLSFLKKRIIDTWIIYFMAVVEPLTRANVQSICDNFVFTKGDTKRLLSCKQMAKKIVRTLDSKRQIPPSKIYRLLEPLAYEVILFIMAKTKTKEAKKRISLFFTKYNGMRVSITGKDLKEIGLKPGPAYKRILDSVLYTKIDGKIKNKKDEIALAMHLAKSKK